MRRVIRGCCGILLVTTSTACVVSFEDYPVGGGAIDGGAASGGSAGSSGSAASGGSGGTAGAAGSAASAGSGGTAGSAGTGTCTNVASCPSGTLSVPPPAAGWLGPVAVSTQGNLVVPVCPDDYSSELVTGYENPVMPECACTCTPPACSASVSFRPNANCTGSVVANTELTPGACQTVIGVDSSLGAFVTVKASCTAVQMSAPPKASFTYERRVCGPKTPPVCTDDALCVVAVPAEFALCIYKPGLDSCPAGPYSQKRELYEGVDDQRTCAPCSCGLSTSACTGVVDFAASTNPCDGSSSATVNTLSSTCVATGNNPAKAGYSVTSPGVCIPSAPVTQGTAELLGTKTLCCYAAGG